MKCTTHNDRTCFLFCKNCDQPVCSSCIISIHQNHTLCEIDDAYEEKVDDTENLNSEVENKIAFLKNEETRLQIYELKRKKSSYGNPDINTEQRRSYKTRLYTDESINSNIELFSKTKSALLKRKENISLTLTSHNPSLVLDECLADIKKIHQPMVPKRASLFQSPPPKKK